MASKDPSGRIAPASSDSTHPLFRALRMKASASSSLTKRSNIRTGGSEESSFGSRAAKRSLLAARLKVSLIAPGGTDSGSVSSTAHRFL